MSTRGLIASHTPAEHYRQDATRAIELLHAVAGDLHDVHYTLMEWEPASKARPRFAKGGRTYTPAESRKAEARTAAWLRQCFDEPMTGNVALACLFFRPNRQRIDVDNMLKHVCDAANGIIWHDDSQVSSVTGVIELDPDRPRTLLAVSPHMSTMTRGTDATYPCGQCGRPIPMNGQTKRRKTCSSDCAARIRGFEPLDIEIPCAECGQPFRRTTRAQRLCSPECRADRVRGSNKMRAQPKSECLDCGRVLTHHRGGRCRECWRLSVATHTTAPVLEGEAGAGAVHTQEALL
jgi:Holliday junction resolvase RusA-like endonuclease